MWSVQDIKRETEPWYRDGLKFECTLCGRCCRCDPGIVWLSAEECRRIADFLNVQEDMLIRDFLIECEHGFVMREKIDMSCIMLQGNRCSIYPVRPLQCRSYPFWPEILKSRESWLSEAARCPGINRGHRWSFKEIREKMLRL